LYLYFRHIASLKISVDEFITYTHTHTYTHAHTQHCTRKKTHTMILRNFCFIPPIDNTVVNSSFTIGEFVRDVALYTNKENMACDWPQSLIDSVN